MYKKLCTNLEESRRLTSILPIETSDMFWEFHPKKDSGGDNCEEYYPRVEHYLSYAREKNEWTKPNKDVPSWSLAALLDLLPNEIKVGKIEYSIDIRKSISSEGKRLYQVSYGVIGKKNIWEDYLATPVYEEFIDACYMMIVKLHENNIDIV